MNININNLKQVNEWFALMQDAAEKKAFLDSVIVEKEESFKRIAEACEKSDLADLKLKEVDEKLATIAIKQKNLEAELAQLDAAKQEFSVASQKLEQGKVSLAQGVVKLESKIAEVEKHALIKERELAVKLKECEDIKSEALATKAALDAKLEQLRKTIEG